MIEKKIHYCWFGGNPLDDKAIKCLESWKRFFPDYEIIRWDENNFDINQNDFMSKAYKAKKWAFVSDVARLIVVYENGGIYFDTDVEVIKSYDDILEESKSSFFGLDMGKYVNSGLGFGAIKGHPFLKELIDEYSTLDFDQYKDNLGKIACPFITNNLLLKHGFVLKDEKQFIFGIDIYPTEYFSPLNFETGKLSKTENAHSIHWYGMSWHSEEEKKEKRKLQRYKTLLGNKFGGIAYDISLNIKKKGLKEFVLNKLKRKR